MTVAAVSLGYAAAELLGTPLVLALGRDSLCYFLAVLTLLWALGWWLLVRDSPAEHPRLSAEQRHYLQRAIGPGVSDRNAVSCKIQTHI
jgi:predicted MFS family arabinose efflux permease